MKTTRRIRRSGVACVLLLFSAFPLFAAAEPAVLPGDSATTPPANKPSPAANNSSAPASATSPAQTPVPNEPLPTPFQPSPIPLGHDFLVGGALDLRTRTATVGRQNGIWINTAELDLQHPITSKGQPRGNIVLQVIAEDPADLPHARDVQIGEAYLLYKLPIHSDTGTTAYVKVGQFQLPFALLAVEDPHLSLVQPLYSQALGLRTDWGAALSGTLYGYLQYDFALTTGTGPNHADVDPNRLVTFRLGRTFTTRNGTVNIGGSLLSGRLPVTDPDQNNPFALELPPSGRSRADRTSVDGDHFTPKTRIAGDATYHYKRVQARGEAVIGADKDNRVLGYFIEGDYHFTPRASALLARSLFVYPLGNSNASREYAGLTYDAGRHLSFSAVYTYLRDVPRDAPGVVRHQFTLQALLRF